MRHRGPILLLVAGLIALAALTGCGTSDDEGGSQQPQGANLRITLGTQEFPEARVLGEPWRQALAVNGYTVDLRNGVGPAEDLDEDLKAGEIDGYVAYTGTVLSIVAGEEVTGLDPDATYDAAKEFYAGQDMVMSAPTVFENRDAIATTRDYAQSNDLDSIEDLAGKRGLRLGARPEFEDLTLGLKGLDETYALTGVEFVSVPLGEQYDALDEGRVEIADAFTTDPALESGDYTVLDDPKRLFGSQNAVMVVGESKLSEIDQDRFLDIVGSVNQALTQEVMVDLNAKVEQGQSEEDVARKFLRDEGLLRSTN